MGGVRVFLNKGLVSTGYEIGIKCARLLRWSQSATMKAWIKISQTA